MHGLQPAWWASMCWTWSARSSALLMRFTTVGTLERSTATGGDMEQLSVARQRHASTTDRCLHPPSPAAAPGSGHGAAELRNRAPAAAPELFGAQAPERVLDCTLRAVGSRHRLKPRSTPFQRGSVCQLSRSWLEASDGPAGCVFIVKFLCKC